MFGSFGMPELLVVLFIVLLLFGARRLPDLAQGLGSAINNFKKGMRGDDEKAAASDRALADRSLAEKGVTEAVPAQKAETTTKAS